MDDSEPSTPKAFFLHRPGAPTILVAMGDQKSCLFCGKSVDRTFEYCPHCGYEFGDSEDYLLPRAEEAAAVSAPPAPGSGEDGDYLVRLRTLQDVLADMEKELDLIIRTSSKDP